MSYRKTTEAAIVAAGGVAQVAEAVGISRQAVTKWIANGKVPADLVLTVEALCEAKVTRYQLRPDVFVENVR